MVGMTDVPGLWRRTLIAWPDGRRDETSLVDWLQGPTCFVDLRSPAGRPSFAGVRRLDDLDAGRIAWLATQEGFAGRLAFDGAYFEWRRAIDYQPATGASDAGALSLSDHGLVEIGRDVPYVEHWSLAEDSRRPCGAARLRDRANGCAGFLVWAGGRFMYARDRSIRLMPGATLADRVAGASRAGALAFVDCEISVGRIGPGDFRIARSSLPYREGSALHPDLLVPGDRATTRDLGSDGAPFERSWDVVELEGDIAALAAIAAPVRGTREPA